MKTVTIQKIGEVKLVDINQLLPHEEINNEYLEDFIVEVISDGYFKTPIAIDKKYKIILDGHHRFSIAKKLGLKKIPVVEVDIFDQNLSVLPFRQEIPVSKEIVISYATQKKLLPHKTTKHVWGKYQIPIKNVLPKIKIYFSILK